MQLHANAALTLNGRKTLAIRVVDLGWTLTRAAAAACVSVKTARKWAARYREEGEAGLVDRSSAPARVANRIDEQRVITIVDLRRLRLTGEQIADKLSMPISTVCGILQRVGLGSLAALEPKEPINRYERERPGELVHIDVKKLGVIGAAGPGHRVTGDRSVRSKGAGWEYVHVCVDDHTRLAYVEVLADERAATAVGVLMRAVEFYASHGVEVERVMTDNGSAYRSTIHSLACRALGLRHIRTRPYTPKTNGKAERFIRTLVGGWAYGAVYSSSSQRTKALKGWLTFYNFERPHRSLGRKPPGWRLDRWKGNNVLGTYI